MGRHSEPIKRLFLVRHAHRDKSQGRELDNGLSAKGKRQVRALSAFFRRNYDHPKVLVISSPKRRCVQTVAWLGKVRESALLDEGSMLGSRAGKFLAWWKDEAPPVVVACSHGDWIPVFLKRAVGLALDLEKSAFVELELSSDGSRIALWWQKG